MRTIALITVLFQCIVITSFGQHNLKLRQWKGGVFRAEFTECQLILDFKDNHLQSFYLKDSSVYFNFDTFYYKLRTNEGNILTVRPLPTGDITVVDSIHGTSLKFLPKKDDPDCHVKHPNGLNMTFIDSTLLSEQYSFCKLEKFSVMDMKFGTASMSYKLSLPDRRYTSWDLSLNLFAAHIPEFHNKPVRISFNCNSFTGFLDLIVVVLKDDTEIWFRGNAKKNNSFFEISKVTKEIHGIRVFERLFKFGKAKEMEIAL